MAHDEGMARRVEAMRQFNRFYTKTIGVLHEGLLQSPFSLTESRILYELAHRDRPTAAELGKELGLDAGYLSRLLKGFAERGLIDRQPSDLDGRQAHVSLTQAGRAAFAPLDACSRADMGAILQALPEAAQERLVAAMATMQALLGDTPERPQPILLRPHRPGDLGWIVSRHAALYAEEYRWDITFEAMVAEIAAKFIQEFKPDCERAWIAEQGGVNVGSVVIVRLSDEVAKLRLLLIEPKARGQGLGRRLVEECIRFSRQVGYKKIALWTNANLLAAQHIYQATGFRLVAEEPHHSFGHDLVGQTWERDL